MRKKSFYLCMIRRLFIFLFLISALLTACTDNDSFGINRGDRLTFTSDTIKFDTLFSTVPSATKTFWIHNESSDGIRIRTARLERGTQSGYRVNVDGTYLDPVGTDFEIRKGDSLLVFVEVTTREVHSKEPQLIEDNLLLTLESGEEQRVNLRTFSWDALKLSELTIHHDTVISSRVPIILYGKGIEVAPDVTLTIRDTELYFHDGAGILVKGQLLADGCLFRGDRLDRMFPYLPYDRVSGQWLGITLTSPSEANVLVNCEIRNAIDALICDSSSVVLTNSIIHNSSGVGLSARQSHVTLSYCQLTNTFGDCLSLEGCEAIVDHCTLAQFYPFSANRGYALHFVNAKKSLPMLLKCTNTLVTGYADDVVMGEVQDTTVVYDYYFSDCLLRTPIVEDSTRFERIIWETSKDSIQGTKHFVNIDEDNLYYDFAIDSISPAYSRSIGRIF